MRTTLLFLLFSANVLGQATLSFDYATELSPDSIKTYLYVLSSDSLEGRETGRSGQKKAAHYLAGKYKEWNIPVRLQKHPLNIRNNSGKNLTINDNNFIFYKDFFYVGPQKDTTVAIHKVLVSGFGISNNGYDDFKGKSVTGENLLVSWKIPNWKKTFKQEHLRPKQAGSLYQFISILTEKNPATIFIVVDSIPLLIHEIESDPILITQLRNLETPVVFINLNIAEKFLPISKKHELYSAHLARLESKGKPKPLLRSSEGSLKMVSDTKIMIGENVIALIEGDSKKDEYVVVSSHYDHLGIRDSAIYYGADDNGSGTSAVLEMARVFQKAKNEGNGPERSVIFLNVSGEEKGLLGSAYYVNHPFVPLKNTVANLNIDMIGRIDEKHDSLKIRDYIYIIGANRLSNELSEINKKANSDFTKLELDFTYDSSSDPNKFYQRSDHYNFAKNNIPIVFYFNGNHPDYHKPTDTPDKIDFPLIKKRAQLVFLTAWELVNRSERIKLNK